MGRMCDTLRTSSQDGLAAAAACLEIIIKSADPDDNTMEFPKPFISCGAMVQALKAARGQLCQACRVIVRAAAELSSVAEQPD